MRRAGPYNQPVLANSVAAGTLVIAPMRATLSVFLDFNLPNATTWLYFSFLLAVALFFKFHRLLSIRNGDVVALFLLAPGMLLIHAPTDRAAARVAALAGQGAAAADAPHLATRIGAFAQEAPQATGADRGLWYGYLWLMCGSAYFFCRCLFDLALVQRPALSPNLSFGGLAWLAGALLICLMAVAFRAHDRAGAGAPVTAVAAAPTTEGVAAFLVQHLFEPPVWAFRLLAVLCHVAVLLGLVVVGWRHFRDPASGMAAATFYLMLPYTGMYVGDPAQAWPAALLVWAVAAYRYPVLAGTLLGLATGTAFFPLLLLPAWVGFYSGRGAGRFLVAWALTLALCVVNLGFALDSADVDWFGLSDGLAAWLPWRVPTTEGFWTGIHNAYRLPVFIAYFAFVLATAVWPSPKNLAHLLALSAAVLVGLQLWYADRGGTYVLWYAPLLLLLTFRPNLQDHRPPALSPETDWLARGRRGLVRLLRRLARIPEPAQTHRA